MSGRITQSEITNILPLGYEPVMELAGRLAFERHEGIPLKFAFLVGTDEVWPAISEVLSADFGIPDYYYRHSLFENDNLELIEKICKANYSIFQIFGAAGFYNVSSSKFVNIIRLRSPSEEDHHIITDLDDLYCFCLDRISSKSGELKEKVCIISTESNGKVNVYSLDDSNNADIQFIWDVSKGEIYRPLDGDRIKKALEYASIDINNENINNENEFGRSLMKVIRKISTTTGEGAMLILTKRRKNVDRFIRRMEYLRPEWQRNLSINCPKELIRAGFVMDGSTLLIRENEEIRIIPRYTVYPFDQSSSTAYGIIDGIIEKLPIMTSSDNVIIERLSGKGSKTFAAANLSHLLNCQVKIITISVDGPVKIWPDELFRQDP